MKKSWMWLIIFMLSTHLIPKESKQILEPFDEKERYLLAVMPFEDKTKEQQYQYLGNPVADQMIYEIFSYQRFRIIEREKLTAVLQELQIQQTDYFKQETVSQLGKQLGAELMLLGSIIHVSENKQKKSLGIISKEETTLEISLEGRLVNLSTGEILAISKWNGKEKTAVKKALGAVKEGEKNKDGLISNALDRATKEMAYDICRQAPRKK
ncbi:MAG: hypothetical protein JW774_10440 [Candidatus Aureabacteria bacterium]|nr:hypothetical protein [Candidatus Auribacterota bacterium]